MFSDGSLKDLHFLITPDVVSVDWIEMYAVTILKVRYYIDGSFINKNKTVTSKYLAKKA